MLDGMLIVAKRCKARPEAPLSNHQVKRVARVLEYYHTQLVNLDSFLESAQNVLPVSVGFPNEAAQNVSFSRKILVQGSRDDLQSALCRA